ncbi:hypothetical protein [Parasitella parasitica]|uniref:Reverse transcriptase domain-containing protein n=1 Tax=Parasitella parasitica TaxID=35722 RepID=A0A0B7MPW2_9FUNG|nr:hypothetical protein [Parasitella parasitica]
MSQRASQKASQNQPVPRQISATNVPEQDMINTSERHTIQDRIKASKYDITADIMDRKADISIGQLLQINPQFHGELTKKKVSSYQLEAAKTDYVLANLNVLDEEEPCTATRSKIVVNGRKVDCLIDCGASKCIMSRQTKDFLGLDIDASSNTVFTLGDNSKVAALGTIYDVPITVGDTTIPINMEVLEATPMPIIIGNNWLQKAKAQIDYTLTILSVTYRQKTSQIPISITRETNPEMLLTKHNIYQYFKPVFEDVQSEKKAVYEEEETDSEDHEEFANLQNDIQDISEVPPLLANDILTCLHTEYNEVQDVKDLVLNNGETMIVPSQSETSFQLNIPQHKAKQIIEINEDYNHYVTLDEVFVEPHQRKLHGKIRYTTENSIRFNDKEPVATLSEISEVHGYDIVNILSTMLPSNSNDSKIQHLPDNKRKLFPSFESAEVPKDIARRLHQILFEYQDIFDWDDGTPTKVTNILQHEIITEDHPPIRERPYRMSPEESVHLKKELDKYMNLGIIRPSNSPWASPIILVKKKNNDYRLVINYKKLNAITKKDAYPLPRIDDLLDSLGTSSVFSSLDMRNAFFQIAMKDNDTDGRSGCTSVEKSGFTTKYGCYEMVRMGQGLCNSPSTFQRCVDICFSSIMYQCVVSYLDDLFCYSKDLESHLLEDLKKVFHCLRKGNLSLNPAKCHFFKRSIKFLGYIVSAEGISTDPEKIAKIKDLPPPSSVTALKSFLGATSYYRRWIPRYAAIARPLYTLTKKDSPGMWTTEVQTAFETLKMHYQPPQY